MIHEVLKYVRHDIERLCCLSITSHYYHEIVHAEFDLEAELHVMLGEIPEAP